MNAGVTFRFRAQHGAKFETTEFCYKNGIADYVAELAGEGPLTQPYYIETGEKRQGPRG